MTDHNQYLLAIDQGTSSSRAVIFDRHAEVISSAQQEFPQEYPQPGWVEHDPEEIWRATVAVVREVVDQAPGGVESIRAIGITNQRETTVVWDAETGKPLHNAIVWQDRRTADTCDTLRQSGHEALVQQRSGLLLDPYFSATKIAWILDNAPDARAMADAGKLCAGTIDSFLIWRLTGGRHHLTDATNASRTALFDIHRQCWDEDLLALFRVPAALLPDVMDCTADFGHAAPDLFGAALPITGVAGDQHAATVGQACFEPGTAKTTYGTGCFALLNTGDRPVQSQNRLLTTVAYRFGGVPTYAVEGSIFIAGAAVQWLRDGLGLIEKASEVEVARHAKGPLRRGTATTLQVNVGWRCDLACHHCHVEAGPKRTEMMDERTAERVLTLLARNPSLATLDLTGGAPELHACFRPLVQGARSLGRAVIDRCNLTVLLEPGQEDTAEFLASERVKVVASTLRSATSPPLER